MFIEINTVLLQVSNLFHDGAVAQDLWMKYEFIKRLLLSIANLVGLIGALRVYIRWHHGDPVNRLIMNWGGSIIFILLITYGFSVIMM